VRPFVISACVGLCVTASATAQSAPAPEIPPTSEQVAAAVLPLPQEFRDSATVLGYKAAGRLVTLREARGDFICLASDPRADRFHVACYHRSLEPFMARGRELRAGGTTGDQVDSVRFAEVKSGKLRMPAHPASLYSLTGPRGSYDPATNSVTGAGHLFVVYIPGATSSSTGLSARPQRGTPWIMFPGTPKAHIMFVPSM
jgi:hypothetical protein